MKCLEGKEETDEIQVEDCVVNKLRCPDHVGVTNVAKGQKNHRLYGKRFWRPGVRLTCFRFIWKILS